jgi:hypothetical protein
LWRTEVRNFLGLTDTVAFPDAILDPRIEEADKRVEDDDEITATNPDYDRLRKHAVGAALVRDFGSGSLSGLGAVGGAGPLKREKVGDVEAEYGSLGGSGGGPGSSAIKDLPGGGYEHEYLRILRKNYKDDLTHVII